MDCKFDIDDNANFRQMNTGGDPYAEKTASEIMAANQGMSYISLDGNIGCMVNGAGLAMATLDSIKYNGGNPANFLDVGGSASEFSLIYQWRTRYRLRPPSSGSFQCEQSLPAQTREP